MNARAAHGPAGPAVTAIDPAHRDIVQTTLVAVFAQEVQGDYAGCEPTREERGRVYNEAVRQEQAFYDWRASDGDGDYQELCGIPVAYQ